MIFMESSFDGLWHYIEMPFQEFECFMAEDGTDYFVRKGKTFIQTRVRESYTNTEVLSPEVYEWMLENVGYEKHCYRVSDRVFFGRDSSVLPDLTDPANEAPVGFDQRNWYVSIESRRIYFRRKQDAAKFKLMFHGVEDGKL